uniref:Putative secreted protein n=1 Tax=Anopheles darlingi TaxID=43151 RepID=A0A2M4DC58_ANODA
MHPWCTHIPITYRLSRLTRSAVELLFFLGGVRGFYAVVCKFERGFFGGGLIMHEEVDGFAKRKTNGGKECHFTW